MLTIQKNIPIPQPVYRYPLYDLEVGDSFLVPMPVGANSNTRRKFQVAVCLAVIRCRDKTGGNSRRSNRPMELDAGERHEPAARTDRLNPD